MSLLLSLSSSSLAAFIVWQAEAQDPSQVCYRVGKSFIAASVSLAVGLKYPKLGFLVSLSGSTSWAYLCLIREKSKLVYCPEDSNQDGDEDSKSSVVEKILDECPSLSSPHYIPTPWASSTWANLCIFGLKQAWDKSRLRTNTFRRQTLTLPDGGSVSIDYLDDGLLLTAPIVIFLHTITGSAKETGHYMRAALRRGWRSCVFLRRGHDRTPLSSPAFNLMGSASDTALQLKALTEAFPKRQFLGMVGVSAGSGLLITYLGMEGKLSPVQAACALCPAYDLRRAFRVAEENPRIDKHILNSMKRLFIRPNQEVLSAHSMDGLINCSNSSTVSEFIEAHIPFTGCSSLTSYYSLHNPVEHLAKVKTPLLIVNSEDDVACLAENIREDIVRATPGILLLRTPRGSHISFNEGLLGTGCYLSRISMDFLESAMKVLEI